MGGVHFLEDEMHEKTRALLEAARAWPSSVPIGPVLRALRDWNAAGRPDLDTAPEPDRLAALEARLDATDQRLDNLHRLLMVAPSGVLPEPPAAAPEPPRFVPTEPGWYWYRANGKDYPAWWEPGFIAGGPECLGPAYPPTVQPTRTEEEARREPRRGDRWRDGYQYTVVRVGQG